MAWTIVLATIVTAVASDHIILRSGIESDIKLLTINDNTVLYNHIGDKTNTVHEVATRDVYMIYIDKKGNFYITDDGKRITGETSRADYKKHDVIYLVKGAEIAAENVKTTSNAVMYTVKSKAGGFKGFMGGNNSSQVWLPRSDVFMIRYKNSLTDVITRLDVVDEPEAEPAPTQTEPEEDEPEYTVIFHTSAKGETINAIAKKYKVTSQEIIDWNELPLRTNPASPLRPKTELMIYQPKEK